MIDDEHFCYSSNVQYCWEFELTGWSSLCHFLMLVKVSLLCLISSLNHLGYVGGHQTMWTIPVLLWVGGYCLTVPFSFLSFPKQRMGQRSCIWKEKAQSTTSTGTMLYTTISVIWLPPIYRRKCPDRFCVVSFCSPIGVLISKYNSLVQKRVQTHEVCICSFVGTWMNIVGSLV